MESVHKACHYSTRPDRSARGDRSVKQRPGLAPRQGKAEQRISRYGVFYICHRHLIGRSHANKIDRKCPSAFASNVQPVWNLVNRRLSGLQHCHSSLIGSFSKADYMIAISRKKNLSNTVHEKRKKKNMELTEAATK